MSEKITDYSLKAHREICDDVGLGTKEITVNCSIHLSMIDMYIVHYTVQRDSFVISIKFGTAGPRRSLHQLVENNRNSEFSKT